MDTAERDDVVQEDDEGGAAGAVGGDDPARLPHVDTAERDDVVQEYVDGGASGSVATAPAPTGLSATASTDTTVNLSWNAVNNANYYKIEYRKSSSSTWLHYNYTSSVSVTAYGLECNGVLTFTC